MPEIRAKVFHLGPLPADDIPVKLIEDLPEKRLVSLDIQGYLGRVWNKKVVYQDWPNKKKALRNVHILKQMNLKWKWSRGKRMHGMLLFI